MYKHRQLSLKYPIPRFIIDFVGPNRDVFTYEYDSKFVSIDKFIPSIESVHVLSEADPGHFFMTNYQNFENPIMVYGDDGHKVQRKLPDD